MPISLNRRQFMAASILTALCVDTGSARQNPAPARWSLPIRTAGEMPGDGFAIRHGFASENTWFNIGRWHTAEDWYRVNDIETAGSEVLAVTDGEVVWIGSEYPGRVVLVQHREELFGMYGHLDYTLDVVVGQKVTAGQVLGRVLAWTDGRAPSHLHLEIRNFFYHTLVNGDTPEYGFNCGYRCPPGPGYWPIEDDKHPAEIGWRNPQHVIHRGILESDAVDEVMVAVTADGLAGPVRSAPSHDASSVQDITLRAGDRFTVVDVEVGDPATTETSAYAYHIWYRVELLSGEPGWLPAMLPDDRDVASDGRPSGQRLVLLPVTT